MQPKRTLRPFSKFKEWCLRHRIPKYLPALLVCVLLGTVALVIGGALSGWKLKEVLTSPTALLVYAIVFLTALLLIVKVGTKR